MKKRKRSIILLCALLIVALILPCSGSEAASKLTKKQKATYKKCLDKYFYKTNWPSWWTSYVNDTKEHTEIAFADINNDGKKELLVYSAAGASWQWRAAYKTNGKPLKFKYYYKGKLRSKSTKSDQHGIYTRITKMSDKAFVDEFGGHMGLYVKTYFKKTKSGGTEVAKYSTRMDPVTYKTINEYYVNGKRTTKRAYQKKVKLLGKFKKITYQNYNDVW